MSKATIQLFMARTWQRGIREAWTALEGGESVDGLRDRLVTLERQLADITPTLETRGHREMMRDLSDAVEQVAEGSNDQLSRRLYEVASLAKSHREATNADPRTVPERRYDLGEARWEDMWSDDQELWTAVRNTPGVGQFAWKYRPDSPLFFGQDEDAFIAQYVRTTDEDGIECWVKRES